MGTTNPAQGTFAIHLEGRAEPFSCRGGETVLEALDRSWGPGRAMIGCKRIPTGCRRGGCGVCRVQVLAGDYRLGPTGRNHVSVEDERQGYALACRLFPESDLTVRPALKEPPPKGAVQPVPVQAVPPNPLSPPGRGSG